MGVPDNDMQLGGPHRRSRLVPVWANPALLSAYSLSSPSDYQRVLKRLAARDPLLVHMMEKAVRRLVHTRGAAATSLSHITADPAAPEPQLMGLRLTACWWQEEGAAAAASAIIVQHGAQVQSAELVPRVLRDFFTLNLLPTVVTIATFQGQVRSSGAGALKHCRPLGGGAALCTNRRFWHCCVTHDAGAVPKCLVARLLWRLQPHSPARSWRGRHQAGPAAAATRPRRQEPTQVRGCCRAQHQPLSGTHAHTCATKPCPPAAAARRAAGNSSAWTPTSWR